MRSPRKSGRTPRPQKLQLEDAENALTPPGSPGQLGGKSPSKLAQSLGSPSSQLLRSPLAHCQLQLSSPAPTPLCEVGLLTCYLFQPDLCCSLDQLRDKSTRITHQKLCKQSLHVMYADVVHMAAAVCNDGSCNSTQQAGPCTGCVYISRPLLHACRVLQWRESKPSQRCRALHP